MCAIAPRDFYSTIGISFMAISPDVSESPEHDNSETSIDGFERG